MNAHNLIQPEEGWTLFTDKNGQELVPECNVDVGDTIGVIDNIKPTIKTNDEISPTIPYRVVEETQGSRPVQTDWIGECYQKIAPLVENFIFATVDLPLHIADNECYSRIWQTVHHGPPIAFDEMQYYIRLLAHETSCTCIGTMRCSDLFTAPVINAIAIGTGKKLMAVLVAHHWRILFVDGLELHWFYSCTGLELHHEITTMVNQLPPDRFESHTHLGSGVEGWCGWDALEAWMEFHNVKIQPETEQISPPLHQQVPAQWMTYHEIMTRHPIFSIQELALVFRTMWFKRILSCIYDFHIQGNKLGMGREDNNMKGKLTGLMISKGHEATESLKVATHVCKLQLGPKDINAMMSKKPSVAYPALLQICKANDIEISGGEEHAVPKLQRFFRSKVSGKPKPVQSIDLAMLVIPAGAFSVEGLLHWNKKPRSNF